MSFEVSFFHQTKPIQWYWPLRIGYIQPDVFDPEQWQHQQWIAQFSKWYLNPSNQKALNILLLDFDASTIKKIIKEGYLQADTVIIRVDQNYFSHNRSDEELEWMRSLADACNAFAVFIVSTNTNVGVWLNELIVELSHNQAIRVALEKVCMSGHCLIDEAQEQSTTLTDLIDKILTNMQGLERSYQEPMQVQCRLCNNGSYTLSDLRREIERNKPRYPFHHESGEATGICQLIDTVEKATGVNLLEAPSASRGAPSSRPSRGGPPRNGGSKPDLSFSIDDITSGSESPKSVDSSSLEHKEEKPVKKKAASKKASPTKPSIDKPRFLQASIRKPASSKKLNHILVSSTYDVHVRIGEKDEKYVEGGEAFPTQEVFKEEHQVKETIQIHFSSNLSPKKQVDELILSKGENSNTVTFSIKTRAKTGEFKGELFAYHQNRLIQKVTLHATILKDESESAKVDPIKMKVEYTLRSNLGDLSERTKFGTSFVFDKEPSSKQAVDGIAGNKPLDLYFSPALNQLMTTIRDRIQEAVVDIDNHPEDLFHPENQKLLIRLALDGNKLFVNHLKNKNNLQGPMQIVSKRSEFIPLDFVYTFAPPDKNSKLCPNSVDALKKGACQQCDGIKDAPAKYVCPFGFWGLSHIIERHTSERFEQKGSGDYTLMAEPLKGRSELHILNKTVFAASKKVGKSEPGLLTKLSQSVKQFSAQADAADDWKQWEKLVKSKHPDSLVLLVHIERDEFTDQDQLEIGEEQFLIQNLFDESRLKGSASDPPPFVILIGCEATQVESHGFDMSSQLMNQGAAIVVTNFTKIRGRQAGPIVMKLLELIKQQKGKESSLGEIVLKLRQQMLAQGIMVGLALMTLGDADWKLKT